MDFVISNQTFKRKCQEETNLVFILVPPLLQHAAKDALYYIVSRTETLQGRVEC